MRIDSHQHFWKFDKSRHAWIDDSMVVLKRDFLPNDLETHLDQHSLDGCVLGQVDQSEAETEYLLSLAAQHSFIKAVIGWVDLGAKNVNDRLRFYAQNPYFKGVRHIVQSEKPDFLLGADFQNGISKLESLNLTFDVLIYPSQLESAIQLATSFPNQKFVLDHLAKPYIKDQKISDWKEKIQRLALSPFVSCKISGLLTEADLNQWEKDDFIPYLDIVFEAFGEDRVLFGSDWPVCLLAGTYDEVLDLVSSYSASFSEEKKKKLFGDNAVRIYNITE